MEYSSTIEFISEWYNRVVPSFLSYLTSLRYIRFVQKRLVSTNKSVFYSRDKKTFVAKYVIFSYTHSFSGNNDQETRDAPNRVLL